jgi:hypothetical protein
VTAKDSEGVESQLLLREVARHHGLLEPEMVDGEQPELPRIHGVQIQPDGPVQVLHLARHALSQHHLRDKVTMNRRAETGPALGAARPLPAPPAR